MKILLFGEFNRTHWNIKEGVRHLGHEAHVVSTRDGFKKVNVDIEIKHYFEGYLLKKLRRLFIRFFNIDIHAISVKHQILKNKNKLSGHDIVQFINEAPFDFSRQDQLHIFKQISSWNKHSFLLSAGLDYPSVKFAFDKQFRYSILSPYFEKKGSKKDFSPALSYLTPQHLILHNYIFKTIKGVISNDLDYHIPLKGHNKYLGMIPHAINCNEVTFNLIAPTNKIVIFHGINRQNYYKKGNDIFEAALDIVKEKHGNLIRISTVEDLPYHEYITKFDEAHILLDQVYAYDQGFNALEAMAMGKVVFTGAEQEWLDYYNLKEDTVAINALPDTNDIANKLEWLILNPKKIQEISHNAREFVEKHHNYIDIAKQYLEKWQSQL
ncbi:glycosyltransferase [Snuella lapsa]|uniref:Glycosyltransferase n=1 Tax=Snuella lapsa TaxID=870481 RepID=A0ABP6XN71_9FLAO